MKRLHLPKNKFARVSINVAFIVIWEELAGLILQIIWETIGELEFFNQDSFLVLFTEILFFILPICLSLIGYGGVKTLWQKRLNETLTTSTTSSPCFTYCC